MGEARSYEQIMANNGQFGSHQYQQPAQPSELDNAFKMGASALKAGWGFLSKATKTVKTKAEEAGITEKVSNMAHAVKAKSDETGFTATMQSAGQKVNIAAANAATYTQEQSKALYASAQDGSLKEKTSKNAAAASAYLSSLGTSLYGKVTSYTEGKEPIQENEQQAQQS